MLLCPRLSAGIFFSSARRCETSAGSEKSSGDMLAATPKPAPIYASRARARSFLIVLWIFWDKGGISGAACNAFAFLV